MQRPRVERFGVIRPNLIQDIRRILNQYPDNGQILKELIQNAEDAGAKTVKILTDRCFFKFPRDEQIPASYFMGPALCVYNDEVFSDADWEGIRMLHLSVKEKDPLKVGRFGLGFKSVFHLTDRIVILSGNYVLYMDPFENEHEYCTRKSIAYLDETELAIVRYCVELPLFGISESTFRPGGGGFRGTLFWFPLRQSPSELSNTVYTGDRLDSLIDAFTGEMSSVMLFLKNTERLEVHSRDAESVWNLVSVSLTPNCLERVRKERQSFLQSISGLEGVFPPQALCQFTNMELDRSDYRQQSSSRDDWIVASYYPGQGELKPEEAKLCTDSSLSYRPCVGIAIPIGKGGMFQGQIFCTLPLPVEMLSATGLPVHVNGYFALDQNRNHLKWPDQLRHREHLESTVRWNLLLVDVLLPRAYARLLELLTLRKVTTPQQLYDFWPDMSRVSEHWRPLAEQVYRNMASKPAFYTEANKGQWIALNRCILRHFPLQVSADMAEAVVKVYKANNQNLVELPTHVEEGLQKLHLLDCVSRVKPTDMNSLVQNCLARANLTRTEKLNILEYLCSQGATNILQNLQLLPLANGSFGVFTKLVPPIFWCEENLLSLFPGLEEQFCDPNLSLSLREYLRSLAASGSLSLKMLQPDSPTLPDLIRQSLERRFGSQPPALNESDAWIRRVWQFLSENPIWVSDLGGFKSLPLLPCSEQIKLKLLPLTGIYVCASVPGMVQLSSAVITCLQKLGVTVLSSLPSYVTRHHGVLGGLVQYPSYDGVNAALGQVCKNHFLRATVVATFNKSATAAERDAIVSTVLQVRTLTEDVKQLFRQLKLFSEARKELPNQSTTAVSVEDVNFIAPAVLPPGPLPWRLLLCSTPSSESAAIKLGAQKIQLKDVVRGVFQIICSKGNSFSTADVDAFMLFFLDNEQLLNDQSLLSLAKQVKFLPTKSGMLRTAGELYDPNSNILKQLFASEERFPVGKYSQQPGLLPKLKKLGLLSESSVRPEDLLTSATLIERMLTNDSSTATQKAEGLLKLHKQYGESIRQKSPQILGELARIRCLPSLQIKEVPVTYPKQLQVLEPGVFKPGEMGCFQQLTLVGSVIPVVCPGIPVDVAVCLQIGSQVQIRHVLQHLKNMICLFRQQSTGDVSRPVDYSQQKFQQDMCADIYRCLAQVNGSNYISFLSATESVWTNDGFVAPSRVAFSTDHDCQPYLFQLEPVFQQHRDLFKAIGVQEKFSPESGAYVLQQIHKEADGRPLSQEKMNLVTRAGQLICDALNRTTKKALDGKNVFLPDQQRIMRSAESLCFCESPWMKESRTEKFVNDNISREIACMLGVKTRQRKLYNSLVKAMPFGQREKLTDRIIRLLHGYTFDSSLLKELIQNADDAGATEIKFITNFRHYRTQDIPEGWEKLQGPALCVYNNRSFTSRDMEGIHNLGRGSKGSDLLKTGQYGVGFNAVYHITDTPSFWTIEDEENPVICVFDPSCQYLPELDPTEPGIKFEDVNEIASNYPDLFATYAETGIDMHCPGTLFRFPLRTEEMAKSSEVSFNQSGEKWHLKPVTCDDISRLLDSFKAEMGMCLLFLNNIESIGLYSANETGLLQLEYSVSKCLEFDEQRSWESYKCRLSELSRQFENELFGPADAELSETVIRFRLEDSVGKVEEWLTVSRIGFENSGDVSAQLVRNWKQEQGKLMPCGAVAVQLYGPRYRTHDCCAFCILPLPLRTGLPMHVNGHFNLGHETRRGLWDNKGDARTEWNETITLQVIVPSYITAIEEIRAIYFPEEAGISQQYLLDFYHSLFPDIDKAAAGIWRHMTDKLYEQIALQELSSFPVVRTDTLTIEWAPVKNSQGFPGYFIDHHEISAWIDEISKPAKQVVLSQGGAYRASDRSADVEETRTRSKRFLQVLKQLNMKALDTPISVMDNFVKCGVHDVQKVSTDTLRQFLMSAEAIVHGRCTLPSLPCLVQNTPFHTASDVRLFLHFLKRDPHFFDNLEGLPLCLRQSEELYFFHHTKEDERPIVSRFLHLLPGSRGLFLHEQICDIFLPETEKTATVLRKFDIPMFASMLPDSLSQDNFKTGNKLVSTWAFPYKHWLKDCWRFLQEQLQSCTQNENSEIRQKMQDKLACLAEWSLLPVKSNQENKGYLCPVKHMKCVVHLASARDQQWPELWDTLRLLPIFFLDTVHLPPVNVAEKVVASISSPAALLDALTSYGNNKLASSREQAECILSYFNACLSALQKSFGNDTILRQKLQSLPFFLDIEGNIVSIPEGTPAFCLESSVPRDGLASWSKGRVLLMRTSDVPDKLRVFLGLASQSSLGFYNNHLLPALEALPRDAIPTHMKYLRDMSRFQPKETDIFFNILKNKAFIEVNGQMHLASNFFNSHEPVFQVMCPASRFPPEPYSDPSWISFMTRAGMISNVTKALFLGFARTLETLQEAMTDDIIRKSGTLIRHLFSRSDLISGNFPEELRYIRFLLPSNWRRAEDGRLALIAEPYEQDRLVSFAESCSEQHLHLVWTSSCIIHRNADPSMQIYSSGINPSVVLCRLGWERKAPKQKVLQHVNNLTDSLSTGDGRAWHDTSLLDVVMTKVYEYLSSLSQGEILQLADLPLVCDIDNKRMLKADSVVIDLPDEYAIPGFIHKAPYHYGRFRQFFMNLGVKQFVTADHYAKVLTNLHTTSSGDVLYPEEKRIAEKAVQGLFRCLSSGSEEQKDLNVSSLYLPSTEWKMINSTDLVFNNDEHLRERCKEVSSEHLHFFLRFDAIEMSNFRLDDYNIISLLPGRFKMSLLSQIIQEAIPVFVKQNSYDGDISSGLAQILRHPECVMAIVRLVCDQRDCELGMDVEQLVNSKLSLISIKEVTGLQTVLVWKSNNVKGSEQLRSSFVEKDESCCTVYLDSNSCRYTGTAQAELSSSLSRAIEFVLRFKPHYGIYLEQIMQNPAQASLLLDRYRVKSYVVRSTSNSLRQLPGKFIARSDHRHLHYDLDCTFNVFDCVGFEEYDPQVGIEDTEEKDPVYKYAVVQRVMRDATRDDLPPFFSSYLVDLGPDDGGQRKLLEKSATQLYRFLRRSATVESMSLDKLDHVLGSIREALSLAWHRLDRTEFNRVMNRLYMHWLPQRNKGNEMFCMHARRHIQDCVL